MVSRITGEILEAVVSCKFKAHLKLAGHQGKKPEYEVMLADLREQVRLKA